MKLYVVRHGQTDINLQRRLQGRRGLPLNKTGIAQAEECAKELALVNFDFVYSSPSERAVQTAGIVSGGKQVITDNMLDVFDVGDADGEIIAELGEMKYGLIPDKEKFNGVEDEIDFLKRVYSFLDGLKVKYAGTDLNILIAGHKCTTGAIDSYFNGLPEDGNFFSLSSKNGKYKIYGI